MSVEKVSDYLERRAKATFRKGYEEVLPLIKDGDSESQLRTVGSVARTENLIGIGTNNRAEGFHFEEKHLSTTEKYEQQAQLAFNDEYMKRADEIDKLRISEAVSQFATGLQEGSTLLRWFKSEKWKQAVALNSHRQTVSTFLNMRKKRN